MAIPGALEDRTTGEGLYIGADHSVIYRNYEADRVTPKDMAGWTIVLDIRKRDLAADPALVTKTGTVSGTFNVDPDTNTQICTFTLADDDLAASVFPGEEPRARYSIKRTDTGVEQPLRYGDVLLTRVTQV